MRQTLRTCGLLFRSWFLLSFVMVGGGMIAIPLMQRRFVDELALISETEMLDYITIAQSAPGAIAINAAVLVGRRLAGVLGAIVSVAAVVLPPLALLTAIQPVYAAVIDLPALGAAFSGMNAAVAALMLHAVLGLGKIVTRREKWLPLSLILLSFALIFWAGVNPIFVMLGCMALGLSVSAAALRRERGAGA